MQQGDAMKLDEVMTTARDTLSVRRVFAEPYEKDGVTIITAANVAGGGGGGGGHDETKGQDGEGGGFGMGAKPAGAYVIKDGVVRWRPAVNVNHLAMVVGAVAMAYLMARARIVKSRTKAAIHGS